MAYFDNAATTYPKPQCVYDFMNEFYRNCGGSVGRGQYNLSLSAGELVDDTRDKIRRILHCPTKQVVFTPSATIALNIIIQGLIAAGSRVIYISPFEHNAVTRTLHFYEKNDKVNIVELPVNDQLEYDLERTKYLFDEKKPDLVIVTHASNVIGLISPLSEIFALAKKYGAITVADMAQSAGLVDCNIGFDCFDFAVFAGHKTLFGPTGISGFVMKPEIDLSPVFFGGTGYESANQNMPDSLPEKFEFGTQNILGIAGLNAALRWIETQGIENLYKEECRKRDMLISILEKYSFIKVVGNIPDRKYVGIVSCLLDGISSESAGEIFSSQNISVRTGLHCAPAAHKFLGTYPAGTIRFSVNTMTCDDDFSELNNAFDYIEENI